MSLTYEEIKHNLKQVLRTNCELNGMNAKETSEYVKASYKDIRSEAMRLENSQYEVTEKGDLI